MKKALAVSLVALGGAVLAMGEGCGSDSGLHASSFPPVIDAGVDAFVLQPSLEGGAGSVLGASCASATAQAARVPVYMLFVLDGSGSMWQDPPNANGNTPPSPKWAAVTGALDALFNQFEDLADPAFGVGLTVFGDRNDPTIMDYSAGPYLKMDVPIGFVDDAQKNLLHARIDLTTPYGGTPTYEVLSGQYPLLENFQPGARLLSGGKRVVVFMTDGVPDPDMPAGQNEGPNSLKLAQAEFQKAAPAGPITLFAVGVGQLNPLDKTVYDPTFMGALAIAGGAPNQPCDPNETVNAANMCHFQITPGTQTADQLQQQFIAALNTIRTRALSCEFTLDKTGGTIDPTRVNVIYTAGNGMQTLLPPSATNGWEYDNPTDPSAVILTGATCDTVKADVAGKIEIVLGCATVIK